jgi:multidrug efflux pump subunit AcrA (membrane-fusion protein)
VLTPGAYSVTGTVTDAQVNQVAVGQRARVLPAGSVEAVTGKVTSVSPEATITSGVATFSVTVTLDGSDPSLHAGSSASISVIVNQVVGVLTVPTSAVRTTGAGSVVQVMVNGAPQARGVTVGAADALRTQILSGLNPGETVVIATISSTVPTTTNGGGGGLLGGGGGGFRGAGGGGRGGGGAAGGGG